ncbi:MAG TPA: right-handed parallel beta-helix repeat-containing protein [Solirubrobacteraceae bacterium]|nr:right-handed parallel beta-helix repeat-containing protein [Solirubrobacteraceae bacterium]
MLSVGCGTSLERSQPRTSSRTGTTYYVSPSGSDSNAGTSPDAPWRTIRRVNDARLAAGDRVLFAGGARFAGTTLIPDTSGTDSAPIVFASYGGRNATIVDGVWFVQNHVTLEHLNLEGPLFGGSGIHGPSDYVTVNHVSIALPAGNHDLGLYANGEHWLVENSSITDAGLSGMLLNGSDYTISGNTITNTGLDRAAPFNNHGIYLDASSSTISDNTIQNFASSGISVRYRDSTITDNTIGGGSLGIDFFQTDAGSGVSRWAHNTITGTTRAGIYVSPAGSGGQTHESFAIESNTVLPTSGVSMNLNPTTGSYTLSGNTCSRMAGSCPDRVG